MKKKLTEIIWQLTRDAAGLEDWPQEVSKPHFLKNPNWLVVEPTPLKNMLVKLEIFPNFWGENKKNWKHHLAKCEPKIH